MPFSRICWFAVARRSAMLTAHHASSLDRPTQHHCCAEPRNAETLWATPLPPIRAEQSITLSATTCMGRLSGMRTPDDEGLMRIALRGEGDDVVGALQLRKGVVLCISPQFHAARARPAVHHACASPGHVPRELKTLLEGLGC